MHHQVFVSYSQPDVASALELVDRLEGAGLGVWIAPRDISPAAEWAAEIIDAIAAARLMVLVFSAHSNTSSQVRREVERAVHKNVPILPFRIEDVLPSKSLEYFLSSQHWLDAFPLPREPHYARLCAHLGALLDPVAGERVARERAPPTAPVARSPENARLVVSDGDLAALQRNLASQIGPVAKYLVRRAAAKACGWDELVDQLAAEIDPAAARKQFLESCRLLRQAAGGAA